MTLTNLLKTALQGVMTNKLRAALTLTLSQRERESKKKPVFAEKTGFLIL